MMNTCGYEFVVYPWYHGDLKRNEAFKAVEEFRQVRSHHNPRHSSEICINHYDEYLWV